MSRQVFEMPDGTRQIFDVPDNAAHHAITMHTESRGDPNAVSPKGARGRMQVMPKTAATPGYGVAPSDGTPEDDERVGRELFDAFLTKYGSPDKAWAAYNAGPGWVNRAVAAAEAAEPGTDQADWRWQLQNDGRSKSAQRETENYIAQNMAALAAQQPPQDAPGRPETPAPAPQAPTLPATVQNAPQAPQTPPDLTLTAQLDPALAQLVTWSEGSGAGARLALDKAAMGLKSVFTDLSDEDKAMLKASRAAADRPGGKVGEITAGMLGAMALPQLLPGKLPLALRAAAESGALSYLLTPSEKEGAGARALDKGKEAGVSALLSGALGALLSGGRKAATGLFKPTEETRELAGQGINPTLAQGAQGRFGQEVGRLSSGVVDTSGRQQNELAQAMAERLDIQYDPSRETMQDFLRRADQHIEGIYDQLYQGKRFLFTNNDRKAVKGIAAGIARGSKNQAEAKEAMAIVNNIFGSGKNTERLGRDGMLHYMTQLEEARSGANNSMVRDALGDVITYLKSNVRDPVFVNSGDYAALRLTDSKWFDYSRVKGAVGVNKDVPGINIKDLAREYNKLPLAQMTPTHEEVVAPALRMTMRGGRAGDQTSSRALIANLRRAMPWLGGAAGYGYISGTMGPLGAAVAAPIGGLYALSIAGQSPRGARALMGLNPRQEALTRWGQTSPYAEGIRRAAGRTVPFLRDNSEDE